MKADGMGPSAIAKALKIGRASVYRAQVGQAVLRGQLCCFIHQLFRGKLASLRARGTVAGAWLARGAERGAYLRRTRFERRRVHRIPLPTFVTIAKRPSCEGGTARKRPLIWGRWKAKCFRDEDWTGKIRLKYLRNSICARIGLDVLR
jgi:hypothetical protein